LEFLSYFSCYFVRNYKELITLNLTYFVRCLFFLWLHYIFNFYMRRTEICAHYIFLNPRKGKVFDFPFCTTLKNNSEGINTLLIFTKTFIWIIFSVLEIFLKFKLFIWGVPFEIRHFFCDFEILCLRFPWFFVVVILWLLLWIM
jgi:hypothetical protein